LLCSCVASKRVSEKAYIAVSVEPNLTGTYYMFASLSYTEGRNFFIHDTAQCTPGDTIIIKDFRRGFFSPKRTLFIKYKN